MGEELLEFEFGDPSDELDLSFDVRAGDRRKVSSSLVQRESTRGRCGDFPTPLLALSAVLLPLFIMISVLFIVLSIIRPPMNFLY